MLILTMLLLLIIFYCFLLKGSNDVLTAKSCDGNVIALDCSSTAFTINILHAAYGSFPYSCGQPYTSATCAALDVKSKVVSKCQDYKVCHFSVSGSLFSYSCQNGPARRQLEVFYQCTSKNIKSKFILNKMTYTSYFKTVIFT